MPAFQVGNTGSNPVTCSTIHALSEKADIDFNKIELLEEAIKGLVEIDEEHFRNEIEALKNTYYRITKEHFIYERKYNLPVISDVMHLPNTKASRDEPRHLHFYLDQTPKFIEDLKDDKYTRCAYELWNYYLAVFALRENARYQVYETLDRLPI